MTSFLESHQEPFGSSFLIGSGLSLVFLYRITPVDSAGTMRREDRVLGPEWEPMHALEINLISAQNLKPPSIQIWPFFIKPAQIRPFLAKPAQIRQWLCVCVQHFLYDEILYCNETINDCFESRRCKDEISLQLFVRNSMCSTFSLWWKQPVDDMIQSKDSGCSVGCWLGEVWWFVGWLIKRK
jgi:hypothetical protein